MKFGVFHELELPRPWNEGDELKLFQDSLKQVELADKLGYDYAWEVQHHFLEEYSHSSAPEVFLAAASQRTTNIRLGHGVCLLPTGYNQPGRVAERLATLDLVSSGRIEFGTGESGSRMELDGYGVDPTQKREMWQEALGQIVDMLAMDPYPGYDGKYFSMPCRNIVPKPVQKPHPPLWVACSNKATIQLAARLGIGAMAFTFLDPAEAKAWVDEYYEIFKTECVPIGHTVNPNILLVTGFGVHQQAEVAIERFLDGIRFFQFALNHYYRTGEHIPGRTDLWGNYMERRSELLRQDLDPVLMRNVANSRGAIGSIEQVRERIGSFKDTGIDQLVFIQQSGKNKHEHICESLDLFAKEIMPEFREGEEARQARKMEMLAPYIAKAFERKNDRRPLWMENVPPVETIDFTRKYKKAATQEYLGSVAPDVVREIVEVNALGSDHGPTATFPVT